MKKLKPHQKHGCDFCRKEDGKTPAVWAEAGIHACNGHKQKLIENRDDGHLTEADYQTWMRL